MFLLFAKKLLTVNWRNIATSTDPVDTQTETHLLNSKAKLLSIFG